MTKVSVYHEEQLDTVSDAKAIDIMFRNWIKKTINTINPDNKCIKNGKWYFSNLIDMVELGYTYEGLDDYTEIREATEQEIKTYNAFTALIYGSRLSHSGFYVNNEK